MFVKRKWGIIVQITLTKGFLESGIHPTGSSKNMEKDQILDRSTTGPSESILGTKPTFKLPFSDSEKISLNVGLVLSTDLDLVHGYLCVRTCILPILLDGNYSNAP